MKIGQQDSIKIEDGPDIPRKMFFEISFEKRKCLKNKKYRFIEYRFLNLECFIFTKCYSSTQQLTK